ncbi:MAG: ribosome recycling factor [Firmicutes bacterium]|jgi:ribosome recycling factor|nr:ribosome recycling factor [Bacillota bacterium]
MVKQQEIEDCKVRMEKAIANLESEYNTIRVGRANPHVLDRIMVDYYGTPTPIQQVGNVSVPEPRMIVIQPWESNMLKTVEKAIMVSDLGIHPNNDGKVIRLVFPELTEEKRKETSKDVRKRGEGAKVALRNIRRDVMELIKKEKKESIITEDDQKDLEEKLQKLTDDYIKKVDQMVDAKTKEVMAV